MFIMDEEGHHILSILSLPHVKTNEDIGIY
jgi:hypothetical protein